LGRKSPRWKEHEGTEESSLEEARVVLWTPDSGLKSCDVIDHVMDRNVKKYDEIIEEKAI
jgi:hypothetical protein